MNVIHVAGTKGKGSTCAFVESFLLAHRARTGSPLRVGLYTSPHLICHCERIRIDSKPLSKELFAQYSFEIFDKFSIRANSGPTYLQLLTLLSFHVFIREGVNTAIYETHHGGENDATNFIQHPLVTSITSLGLDHIKSLGPTLKEVAWHKGGIFKAGAHAFSAPQPDDALQVLNKRAAEKGAPLEVVNIDASIPGIQQLPSVQQLNCSLARRITDTSLARRGFDRLTQQDVVSGIQNFTWPGRFQIIKGPQHGIWFLDGAHNELSIGVAAEWYMTESLRMQYVLVLCAVNITLTSHRAATKRVLIFAHISENRDGFKMLQMLAQNPRLELGQVIVTTYSALGMAI